MRATRIATAALAAALIALGGCGENGSDTVDRETATAAAPEAPEAEQPLSAAEEQGREVFVQTCGSCHTFDAAGTIGQIGPNLGDIPLSEEEVLTAIRTGGRGSGNMPPNLVTGRDAQDVAAFVAASGPGVGAP